MVVPARLLLPEVVRRGCEYWGGSKLERIVLSRLPSQPLYRRLGPGESVSGYKRGFLFYLCLAFQVVVTESVQPPGPSIGLDGLEFCAWRSFWWATGLDMRRVC